MACGFFRLVTIVWARMCVILFIQGISKENGTGKDTIAFIAKETKGH